MNFHYKTNKQHKMKSNGSGMVDALFIGIINKFSDTPLYLNFFNDYGLVWENKTIPTNSDNSIRGSYGFGIKYYSPIGPVGFTWGFPLMDKDYDIKRMFMFQIGYID